MTGRRQESRGRHEGRKNRLTRTQELDSLPPTQTAAAACVATLLLGKLQITLFCLI